jgi:hypothetical protein
MKKVETLENRTDEEIMKDSENTVNTCLSTDQNCSLSSQGYWSLSSILKQGKLVVVQWKEIIWRASCLSCSFRSQRYLSLGNYSKDQALVWRVGLATGERL